MSYDVTLQGGPFDGRTVSVESGRTIVLPLITDSGLIYSARYVRRDQVSAACNDYQWLQRCEVCDGSREVDGHECVSCHGFGSYSVRSLGVPGSGEPVEREWYDLPQAAS